jgi:hypothetical protein
MEKGFMDLPSRLFVMEEEQVGGVPEVDVEDTELHLLGLFSERHVLYRGDCLSICDLIISLEVIGHVLPNIVEESHCLLPFVGGVATRRSPADREVSSP